MIQKYMEYAMPGDIQTELYKHNPQIFSNIITLEMNPQKTMTTSTNKDTQIITQTTKTNWINMKDTRPHKNGYYLCWYMHSKCGDKEDWVVDKLYWEDNLWLYKHNSFSVMAYVTHWMPLPDKPVMESE